MRIELATSSLPRKCSTTELQQQEWILSIDSDFTLHYGAEDGTQTRDPQLGRLMLYQLSYFRKFISNFFDLKITIVFENLRGVIVNRKSLNRK